MGRKLPRILVTGEDLLRAEVVARLDEAAICDVVDGDPDLGDLVMYIRLEGVRYDAFLFLGQAHPVTRGGLAIVAERAVLAPLVNGSGDVDPLYDTYLYRLPRALVFRDDAERQLVVAAVPKSVETPGEVVGRGFDDLAALGRAFEQATRGFWSWAAFVHQVEAEAAAATLRS